MQTKELFVIILSFLFDWNSHGAGPKIGQVAITEGGGTTDPHGQIREAAAQLGKKSGRQAIVIDVLKEAQKQDAGDGLNYAERYEAYIRETLETIYPKNKIRLVRGGSTEELRKNNGIVARDMGPGTLESMVILSHGTNFDDDPTGGGEAPLDQRAGALLTSADGKASSSEGAFLVNLLDPISTDEVFSSYKKKWAPYSKVVLMACDTVGCGNLEQKARKAAKIAENMGLKSGTIFMAEGDCRLLSRQYARNIFEGGDGVEVGFNAVMLAVVPILYLMDECAGYTFEIIEYKNKRTVRVFEDNVVEALRRDSFIDKTFLHATQFRKMNADSTKKTDTPGSGGVDIDKTNLGTQ